MELTVRRKLAGLDDAYNVFHAPIYTYNVFSAFILTLFPNDAFFKQKHLRIISENTFRGELILFSYLVKIVLEIGRTLQCIDNNIFNLY